MPSCSSEAEPEKVISLPTFQVLVESGLPIFATGGVLPGEISMVSESLLPAASVTVSYATYVPASWYVWEAEAPAASTGPSPVKSHS